MVCVDNNGNLIVDEFIMCSQDLFDKEKTQKLRQSKDAR